MRRRYYIVYSNAALHPEDEDEEARIFIWADHPIDEYTDNWWNVWADVNGEQSNEEFAINKTLIREVWTV